MFKRKHLISILHSSVRVDLFALVMTLALFYQFLTARILERIQQIYKEVCRGCEMQFKFATLHPCETNTLFQRVNLFLPSAKVEGLEKIEGLVRNYKCMFSLFHDEEVYMKAGDTFLQSLQPLQFFDTKFINEESEATFGFDSSWRDFDTLTQMCNKVFGEVDFSSKNTMEEQTNIQEEIVVKKRKVLPKSNKIPKAKNTKNKKKAFDKDLRAGLKSNDVINYS